MSDMDENLINFSICDYAIAKTDWGFFSFINICHWETVKSAIIHENVSEKWFWLK